MLALLIHIFTYTFLDLIFIALPVSLLPLRVVLGSGDVTAILAFSANTETKIYVIFTRTYRCAFIYCSVIYVFGCSNSYVIW